MACDGFKDLLFFHPLEEMIQFDGCIFLKSGVWPPTISSWHVLNETLEVQALI